MKISNDEIKKAFKIKNAVQHYLEMTKEVNIRSTDVFPYLVRKGIFVQDKNNGLFFRRFLKKLYKANMLKSLIPQCSYVPGINGEIFGEWYFNTHDSGLKKSNQEELIIAERDNANSDLDFESSKEILYQLIEGINPITGTKIDPQEEPELFKVGKAINIFINSGSNNEEKQSPNKIEGYKEVDIESNSKLNSQITASVKIDKRPAYSIDDIRKSHENAYKPWTPEEESFLTELFDQGLTIKEIARKMKRQNGGIRSRLKKLGLKFK